MITGASTIPPIARLAPASRSKRSGGRTALRIAAALAGSFLLVVSLVDPRHGSGLHYANNETLETGARHE